MKLNKDRHIGRVLFIVEGSRTEFSILRRIFCNLLGYSYIEKRRNRPICFASTNDCFSKVGVINTRESNIRDISENETYLDDVFDVLREQYQFPVDQSAIYYLFDRDPKSNTDSALIEKYILSLANPYPVTCQFIIGTFFTKIADPAFKFRNKYFLCPGRTCQLFSYVRAILLDLFF